MLSFQKLHVYHCAIEFAASAAAVTSGTPRGHAALCDQLRRAAFSVPLNIAEAAGRISEAEAARHYAIARGSAMECAAAWDVMHILKLASDREYERGAELLERTVAMLTRLCYAEIKKRRAELPADVRLANADIVDTRRAAHHDDSDDVDVPDRY